jgi:hypothetical protein
VDHQTYAAPYPPPPAPPAWNGKTNGLAIASLALALIACGAGVPSVVMGIAGLRQSRRNGDRRGTAYAIAGLSIGSLWLLAILIAVAVAAVNNIADGPDRDATGAVRGERSISLMDVRAGDCIKDLDSETGTSVDVVPCTSPHTSEIFAVVTLPDGPWPGTSKIETDAQADCDRRFPEYAGTQPDEDAYLIFPAPPQEVDWPTDREVLCIAHQREGTTTGSLRR